MDFSPCCSHRTIASMDVATASAHRIRTAPLLLRYILFHGRSRTSSVGGSISSLLQLTGTFKCKVERAFEVAMSRISHPRDCVTLNQRRLTRCLSSARACGGYISAMKSRLKGKNYLVGVIANDCLSYHNSSKSARLLDLPCSHKKRKSVACVAEIPRFATRTKIWKDNLGFPNYHLDSVIRSDHSGPYSICLRKMNRLDFNEQHPPNEYIESTMQHESEHAADRLRDARPR